MEEIKNDIDKLDGMMKIKGKCGYEMIGGCSDLRRLKQENAELKEELQKYKDMEAKGLEEFKDVGGCWGCGIQLASDEYFASCCKYSQALEEIRGICESSKVLNCDECPICDDCEELCVNDDNLQNIILDKINEVLGK